MKADQQILNLQVKIAQNRTCLGERRNLRYQKADSGSSGKLKTEHLKNFRIRCSNLAGFVITLSRFRHQTCDKAEPLLQLVLLVRENSKCWIPNFFQLAGSENDSEGRGMTH